RVRLRNDEHETWNNAQAVGDVLLGTGCDRLRRDELASLHTTIEANVGQNRSVGRVLGCRTDQQIAIGGVGHLAVVVVPVEGHALGPGLAGVLDELEDSDNLPLKGESLGDRGGSDHKERANLIGATAHNATAWSG